MPSQEVELSSVQVPAAGDGDTIECRNAQRESTHLQFPSRAVYQLMRMLPRIDAAMHHGQRLPSSAVPAYPVVGWSVERSGLRHDVALCMRTDRQVESGFTLDCVSARALHRELGDAIAHATQSGGASVPPPASNACH